MKASVMNIFVVSSDYVECAQALDDLRLNEMILKTAQLLSVAARALFNVSEVEIPELYVSTHVNHPCAKWARASKANFVWLLNYFEALANERKYRFNRTHLSFDKLYEPLLNLVYSLPEKEYVEVCTAAVKPQFTFNCSTFFGEIHTCYKLCLIGKWANDKQPPKWTKRGAPAFINHKFRAA